MIKHRKRQTNTHTDRPVYYGEKPKDSRGHTTETESSISKASTPQNNTQPPFVSGYKNLYLTADTITPLTNKHTHLHTHILYIIYMKRNPRTAAEQEGDATQKRAKKKASKRYCLLLLKLLLSVSPYPLANNNTY